MGTRSIEAKLAQCAKAPLSLTELSLARSALPAFPEQILECRKLRKLDLSGALGDWSAGEVVLLPESIAKLGELEDLKLGWASFDRLPAGIGRLSKLKKLELDQDYRLRALPDSFGSLSALDVLDLSSTGVKKLPKTIGKMRLRRLVLQPSMEKVPPEIWAITTLRELVLPRDAAKLPPGIGRLGSLERLSLAAPALISIAGELPSLTGLRSLTVQMPPDEHKETWKLESLPDEIMLLRKLESLEASFVGLKRLPRDFGRLPIKDLLVPGNALTDLEPIRMLVRLRRLDASTNRITSLAGVMDALVKLVKLDVSDNPLPIAERRRVDQMMKLAPSARRKLASSTPAPTASAAKEKPVRLGSASSLNASLAVVLVDAKHAPDFWKSDDDEGWAQLTGKIRAGRSAVPLAIGRGRGLGVALGVGKGIATVHRVGTAVVVVEGFVADEKDPLFLEYVASAVGSLAKQIGMLEIESGSIAVLPTYGDFSALASMPSPRNDKSGIPVGEDAKGVVLKLARGTYRVRVEKKVSASWGEAARVRVELVSAASPATSARRLELVEGTSANRKT